MSITSIYFWGFVLLIFLFYNCLKEKHRWKVLLLANLCFFLMFSSWKLLILTLLLLLFNYSVAIYTENNEEKIIVWLVGMAVVGNVCFLIGFKELGFFMNNVNVIRSLLHLRPCDFSFVDTIVAPIGISYFLLGQISYLLEVKWGMKCEKNYFKFLTYALFFPVLISGPILRFYEVSDTLYRGNQIGFKDVCFALQRILWGLFKKIVLADRLGIIVSSVWNGEYKGLIVFCGVLGYALQVYMDFSGCMDICIGVANLFGITLPENFQTPLFALSLSEYWRRWHITLGAWVRDYVLNPILKSQPLQRIGKKTKERFGKKTGRKIPTWIGMFFVWLTVGFWHGGAWTFIFGSGLFFFIMIVGGQILEPIGTKLVQIFRIPVKSLWWKTFQRLRTFILFAISISFSWSKTMKDGFLMWKRCFSGIELHNLYPDTLLQLGINQYEYLVLLLGFILVFIVSNLQQRGSVRDMIAQKSIVLRWIINLALFFAVLVMGMYGPGYDASAFIYGEF